MIALVYEGISEDPMSQTVRAVNADSLDHARELFPHAVMIQMYVEPERDDPPPIDRMLRHAIPVWRF